MPRETSTPQGLVFDVQRFSLHDGPGIRTTVFLKGCPLRCRWCHNPESLRSAPEIALDLRLCQRCGACAAVCPNGCHRVEGAEHTFDRARCTACGRCFAACDAGALEQIGRRWSVDEVLRQVERDRPFYEATGGGLTVSGGEPMAQFEFTRALLAAARAAGLHACLDTSGFGPGRRYTAIADHADLFLFDCKETDPARHRAFTGVPLAGILANLRRLDERGAANVLRCPLVPGANLRDDHCDGVARLAGTLRNLRAIHVLPYHPLGAGKRARLGLPPADRIAPAGADEVAARWIARLAAQTTAPVLRPDA